ncbi:DEAD/DEAH box helicase family protein [Micrococcales bacterium 31B]|nr:DEAD/DEAH box helicase family protein [Micrococcales bacterium 31B]
MQDSPQSTGGARRASTRQVHYPRYTVNFDSSTNPRGPGATPETADRAPADPGAAQPANAAQPGAAQPVIAASARERLLARVNARAAGGAPTVDLGESDTPAPGRHEPSPAPGASAPNRAPGASAPNDAERLAKHVRPRAREATLPAHSPQHPSAAAASHLPPAFPARAPWGTSGKLRAWQQEALDLYLGRAPRDFLAVATPGAGKTTFALRIATELLSAGTVNQVTVVAPTEHLKTQWADSAARVGISLDPNFKNSQGATNRGYDGVALTYAQIGMNPNVHRARTENSRTLVILDEVHHAGDALSWGDGVRDAFDGATRRLALTGTPFRSDTAPIPFIEYEEDDEGLRRSRADYTYGYAEALRDHVVRPVIFLSYTGEMRWRTKTGDELSARLGDAVTKDVTAQAWRTALDPEGQWIPSVLDAANKRLTQLRRGMPDAGGLVIATDQNKARAYAKILREITGERVTTVLSDDDGASARIEEFAEGDSRWMVAVRMVSEGVDVPRLAVGVYATSTSTPLFFAQAVGRFVRARKRGETASVFVPSVPILMTLANQLELQRDHVLDRPEREGDDEFFNPEDAELAAANREEKASDDLALFKFESLDSQATFDRVLFDGGEFGVEAEVGSDEELEFLGIPGLLEPDQVSTLLRQRQAAQLAKQKKLEKKARGVSAPEQPSTAMGAAFGAAVASGSGGLVDHRRIAELRKELNATVAGYAKVTGQPHAQVHSKLRRDCGGPAVPQAGAEDLEKRIRTVRRWFVEARA